MSLTFTSPVTLLCGENGIGKTAVLEAIHLLSTTYSFATRMTKPLVKVGHRQLVVSGDFSNGDRIGVMKQLDGQQKIRFNRNDLTKVSELAVHYPMVVFDHGLMSLLDGSPEQRRNILHWGMFHVKHDYHGCLMQYRHALKQRNALLRNNTGDAKQFEYWETQLAHTGLCLEKWHRQYLADIVPEVDKLLAEMQFPVNLTIDYRSGWPRCYQPLSEETLQQALADNRSSDLACGYTQRGLHRCDLALLCSDMGKHQLSRGQKKMAAILLRLAQTSLIDKPCIMLIDDIHAELSEAWFSMVVQRLAAQGIQLFMTLLSEESAIAESVDCQWVRLAELAGSKTTKNQ